MALHDTRAVLPSGEQSFKVSYDVQRDLYVALYGCDDCVEDMKNRQGSLAKEYRHLYDDALDYTDGFVMEVNMQFPTPTGNYDAELRAVCVENTRLSDLKSCVGLAWREDQTPGFQFLFRSYLNTYSWLFSDAIDSSLNSPVLPNNIWEPAVNYPGLFGNWIVRTPVDDGTTVTVTAYRHLPKDDYEYPDWLWYTNDVRFLPEDHCQIYTYYQTGNTVGTNDPINWHGLNPANAVNPTGYTVMNRLVLQGAFNSLSTYAPLVVGVLSLLSIF